MAQASIWISRSGQRAKIWSCLCLHVKIDWQRGRVGKLGDDGSNAVYPVSNQRVAFPRPHGPPLWLLLLLTSFSTDHASPFGMATLDLRTLKFLSHCPSSRELEAEKNGLHGCFLLRWPTVHQSTEQRRALSQSFVTILAHVKKDSVWPSRPVCRRNQQSAGLKLRPATRTCFTSTMIISAFKLHYPSYHGTSQIPPIPPAGSVSPGLQCVLDINC